MITPDTPFSWGKKYFNVPIKDIPASYLLFALEQLRIPNNCRYGFRDLMTYLEQNEAALKGKVKIEMKKH